MSERRFITPEEAVSLLNDGEQIHTFRNNPGMLIGCDHNREGLIEKINKYPLEIGGETSRRMKHALILED